MPPSYPFECRAPICYGCLKLMNSITFNLTKFFYIGKLGRSPEIILGYFNLDLILGMVLDYFYALPFIHLGMPTLLITSM